jgi:hypothetical protein
MNEEPTPPLQPQPNGESNPTPAPQTSEIKTPSQPPTEPPTQSEEENPTKNRRWLKRGKSALIWAWKLFAEIVTILWVVALLDSYRPKITITPGGTLNAKNPFGTYFIIQNQGDLPISHVSYITHLTLYPPPGNTNQSFVTAEQNVSVIPQMKSLEMFTLGIQYTSVKINAEPAAMANAITNPPAGTRTMKTALITLKFDVSYYAKFFPGKRTDTLYFFGQPDVDGNWQWLPSAHGSITDQIIDTNLLPRVQSSPAPVAIPTNGSPQVHKN